MEWNKARSAFFVGGAIGYFIGWIFSSPWTSYILFFLIGYIGYYYQKVWQKFKQISLPSFLEIKEMVWDKNPAKFFSYFFFLIVMYFPLASLWSGFEHTSSGAAIGFYEAVRNLEIGKLAYAPLGTFLDIFGQPWWVIWIFVFICLPMFFFLAIIAGFVGVGVQLFLVHLFNGNIIELLLTGIVALVYLAKERWLGALGTALRGIGIAFYFSVIFVPLIFLRSSLRFLIVIHSWQRVACGLYILAGGAIYLLFAPFQFSLFITSGLAIGCGLFCMGFGYLLCRGLVSVRVKELSRAVIWPLKPVVENS